MIILGVILLVVGYYVLPMPLLVTLGLVLVVAGVILELFSIAGRPIGGRRHYY